jgi:cardiolipin synthase
VAVPPHQTRPSVAVSDREFPEAAAAHTHAAVLSGNAVKLLSNGDRIFPAKLQIIPAARRSLSYGEYFYAEGERWWRSTLYNVGALSMEKEHRRTVEAAGCEVATFRPIGRLTIRCINNRNHRRILVADGRIAVTGGSGVSWKWRGDGRQAEHRRDTDVLVESPVVAQLQAAFAEDWREATGEVLGGAIWFPPLSETRGGLAAQRERATGHLRELGTSPAHIAAVRVDLDAAPFAALKPLGIGPTARRRVAPCAGH